MLPLVMQQAFQHIAGVGLVVAVAQQLLLENVAGILLQYLAEIGAVNSLPGMFSGIAEDGLEARRITDGRWIRPGRRRRFLLRIAA